ncbi:MAG: formimidoylglutamate deiminase, partial [Hyphomicrobiaceae bacterium]
SNVLISLAVELRTLEYGQRLRDRRRNRLAAPGRSIGRTLFEASLVGGQQAGGVAVGRDDRVVLASDAIELVGRTGDGLLDALIFASGRSLVSEVWAGGRKVVEGGRHIGRAMAELHFAKVMARLMA